MRSSARTMLAKCGFADPDRKESMHDAACAYVAAKSRELCRRLFTPCIGKTYPSLEEPICKGTDQYKTMVGFADVIVRTDEWTWTCGYLDRSDGELLDLLSRCGLKSEYGSYFTHMELRRGLRVLGVEVKWLHSPVSEAVRQIALYQQHTPGMTWCLAAPWAVNLEEKRTLDSRHIKFVRLDEAKVRSFADEQRGTESPTEIAI